ncbi:MAG: outer membrane protein assembly factor BamE [Dongiaceae bacterium]
MAAVLACGALGACATRVDTRGNLPDPDDVLAVHPGAQDKQQVAEILGTPSTLGTFDDKIWYYVSKRTETVAFFQPKVTDQQVVVITFDDLDMVEDVKLYGLEDALAIQPVARETPTYGQELTIIQQLLGNVGRFVKAEEDQ